MKIHGISHHTFGELRTRLREVPLQANPSALVYEDADIFLGENVNPGELWPTQRYALQSQLNTLSELSLSLRPWRVDPLRLDGFVTLWIDGEDGKMTAVDLLPPVIELALGRKGYAHRIIADGMHRVTLAKLKGRRCNVVYVFGSSFPYYAWEVVDGWDGARCFRDQAHLDEFAAFNQMYGWKKRDYRIEPKERLFRNFNAVFDGVWRGAR